MIILYLSYFICFLFILFFKCRSHSNTPRKSTFLTWLTHFINFSFTVNNNNKNKNTLCLKPQTGTSIQYYTSIRNVKNNKNPISRWKYSQLSSGSEFVNKNKARTVSLLFVLLVFELNPQKQPLGYVLASAVQLQHDVWVESIQW